MARELVGKQDAAPYTQHDDIPWLRLFSRDPQAFSSQQLSMKGLPAASFFSKQYENLVWYNALCKRVKETMVILQA